MQPGPRAACLLAMGLCSLPLPAQSSVTVTLFDPTRAFAGFTTEITGASRGQEFRVFTMNGSPRRFSTVSRFLAASG